MYKVLIALGICFSVVACNKQYAPVNVAPSNVKVDSLTSAQSSITKIIAPYKTQLDAEMNRVVATTNTTLTKQQPEGTLGNLMSDAAFKTANTQFDKPIDLAILNYGGIRLPSINKGNITTRQLYELMPFDNFVVVLEIDGATLKQAFNKIANYGGWPITNASFEIKNNQAQNISINQQPLVESKTYYLAISDYVANGGDKMSMLIPLKQHNTGILLRDAIISYVQQYSSTPLNYQLQNRVTLAQ